MKKVYIGVAIVVLAALGLLALNNPFDDSTDNNNNQQAESSEQTNAENAEQTGEDTITFSEDGKTVTYSGEAGKDALTILKERTEVTTESSDLGEFVTAINGVEADPNTEFWAFYVNGELASEGAGTYQTEDADTIEWRIDKIEL